MKKPDGTPSAPMLTRTRFGGCLTFYGGLLALLALLAWLRFESGAQVLPATLWVGGAAGLLCVGWGVALAAGRQGRAGAVLTLAVLAYTLLVQAVHGWVGNAAEKSEGTLVPVLATLLFLSTLGLLMWVLYGRMNAGELPTRPGQGSRGGTTGARAAAVRPS